MSTVFSVPSLFTIAPHQPPIQARILPNRTFKFSTMYFVHSPTRLHCNFSFYREGRLLQFSLNQTCYIIQSLKGLFFSPLHCLVVSQGRILNSEIQKFYSYLTQNK